MAVFPSMFCVLALHIVVFCLFERQIFIYMHEFGVHVAYAGPLGTVQYILFGCPRMPVFYKDFFDGVLYLFNRRSCRVTHFQKIQLDLLCQISCHLLVATAQNSCRIKNSVADLVNAEFNDTSVSLYYTFNFSHRYVPLLLFSSLHYI